MGTMFMERLSKKLSKNFCALTRILEYGIKNKYRKETVEEE